MNLDTAFQRLRQTDNARPGIAGEHWLVLGAGLVLFLYAGRSRSAIVRSVLRTAASGLVARAAGGRDGLRRVVR